MTFALQFLHRDKVHRRIQASQEIARLGPAREHEYLMSPAQLDYLMRHGLAALRIAAASSELRCQRTEVQAGLHGSRNVRNC